ncbi:MAG: hypothetical protein H6R10_607 [Rhodocyclaceae bacterium]|nr:hypothetical protein [Rhodocyclaceae bacterium]
MVDLSLLTNAVDVSSVVAGVVSVGALLMAPAVAKYAVNAIRRMLPGEEFSEWEDYYNDRF